MKKIAIIYGALRSGVYKKAVEMLSQFLLDYTYEYPVCLAYDPEADYSMYRCIYIGTREDNAYIAASGMEAQLQPQGYHIKVVSGTVTIEGADDVGLLYGCIDFYNKYIMKFEFPHDDAYYRINFFEKDLPDFEYSSAPAVKNRGIWTWGHVIYDYRGFIDNMVKLKMNTLIMWNDFVPINGKEIVDYAHTYGVKIIWGFPWCWDTNCAQFDLETVFEFSGEIFEKYEREYAALGGDGIYFQSFTELNQERIGGILIAEAVTEFVNRTSALFYEKYPDIELQFGLHADSVKNRLEYLKKVDPRMRIVWENCGAFPFSYIPADVKNFDQTVDFVDKIAVLRGEDDHFGVVTKGFTKLLWPEFEHLTGPVNIGTASEYMKRDRIIRKSRVWKYLQAYWLTNADKAYEMVQAMAARKDGDLDITALVEDGMFEENIMYPVALYSEMLWDCGADIKTMMSEVALRNYVTFA